MANESHRKVNTHFPPTSTSRDNKKSPPRPTPLSPDPSLRNAREKPDSVVETSTASGPTHLRTPESVTGEALSDTPMDSETQARRNKARSPPRRPSFKADCYRPTPSSNSLRRDHSPPPKAPLPATEIEPSLSNGQPRARPPPKRPTAAPANDTETSGGSPATTLRQSIGYLASTITRAASISARRDLWAKEASEQKNVYKSQLKHKDAFATLFEEAAFRAAQAERSSRRVNDELKEVQLAQDAAVEKLTETLAVGYTKQSTQQASNADQSLQQAREDIDNVWKSLRKTRDSLDDICRDIDSINRNAVWHDEIEKRLSLYATKQQLLDVTPAKGEMSEKDRELQQTPDMIRKHSMALDQMKSKLAELEEKKKDAIALALDQAKSKIVELEEMSGRQDHKIKALEGQLEPVTKDLAACHIRLASIEQAPPVMEQVITAVSSLGDGLAKTAEEGQTAVEDRIESMNQRLNALSEELQKAQALPNRVEESASSNPPDEYLDKAVETTVGHFRIEMDQRGQIITEALSELSSYINKVAEDLESFRTNTHVAQAQQQPSSSSGTVPPPVTIPPAIPDPVPAAAASTAPPPSLPSAATPNTMVMSPVKTNPSQSAGPARSHEQPLIETFQNMLEQHSLRITGEAETLRLMMNGQQQWLDGLRNAVEQLFNSHPVQLSAHIQRLHQNLQFLEQQQKAQTRELETSLRNLKTAEVDPLKSQLESSKKSLEELEGQVLTLTQTTSTFKIEQGRVNQGLIREIQDGKNAVTELNDRVNTVNGQTHIDILSLKEQVAAVKTDKALSLTVAAATNHRANSGELDSDEPMINRTRPSEKRTPIASVQNNKRKVPFDSSDENDEPLASTRKLDRVVRRMNVSKRGDTTS